MSKKPNIIFILTDDQGYWSLGSYGNKDIISPNLDKLANDGVIFENFFCASPVCSPARASIFTGKIPSQHGVHDWIIEKHNDTTEYIKGQETFVNQLSLNGYSCCLSGKWHLGNSEKIQQGFHQWYVHEKGGGPYYNAPMYKNGVFIQEKEYITDAITNYGIEFIVENRLKTPDKPFYLSLHYTAPHAPWDKKNHPKEILDMYDECKFESCPRDIFHEWKIKETFSGEEKERLEILKGYFASITSIDLNFKKIREKLIELDILEDTLIIFTSDNGMNMGHHGIFGKGNGTSPQNMYDTSVKVPMIFSHLNKIETGLTLKNLYSHYDIFPTILDYVGIDFNFKSNFPGTSFLNELLSKETEKSKNIVIYDEYGPVRMVRTKEWKYIHRYPYGPHEFYNLITDKEEKRNEINNKEYLNQIIEARKQMELWFLKYVNPEIDGAKEPVFGGGQRKMAGLWGSGNDVYEKYTSDIIFEYENILKNK